MPMNSTAISGVHVDDNRFTTVAELGWLLDHTIPGENLEAAIHEAADKEAGRISTNTHTDKRTLELAKIRSKMQRPFRVQSMKNKSVNGRKIMIPTLKPTAKHKNAYGPLKKYLISDFAGSPNGSFGVLPAFVLLWPERLEESPLPANIPGFGRAKWVSYDTAGVGRAVVVDGESRVAAALAIRNDPNIPHTLRDQLMQQPVTIEGFHGLDPARAAQAFIDLNFEGVKVDNITRANIDPRNKWVKVTRDVFEELGIQLALDGRQITAAHIAMGKSLLLTHGVQMVKAIVMGPGALTNKKTGPNSWKDINFDKLHSASVGWFREIFDYFETDVLTDKLRVIRSVPVRVALASLGSAHYVGDRDKRAKASDVLTSVDWRVSPAWNGLGGKVTVKDNGDVSMASGSGKELCTAVISALTKPETRKGKEIRNGW